MTTEDQKDLTDSASQSDAAPNSSPATDPKVEPASAESSNTIKLWPLWVAILVLVVGIGILAGLGWKEKQRIQNQIADQVSQTALDQALNPLQQEVNSLNELRSLSDTVKTELDQALTKTRTQLDQQLSSIEQEASANSKQVEAFADQMNFLSEKVIALAGTDRSDWLLAEAEYLLRLANHRLQIEGDVAGAESIMVEANKLLGELDDPLLFKVREKLASEIGALQIVPKVDVAGSYLKLETLIEQIGRIDNEQYLSNLEYNYFGEESDATEAPTEMATDATKEMPMDEGFGGKAKRYLNTAVANVKDVLDQTIIITDLDEPPAPPMTPQFRYYLQQNLKLMVEQAQVALLRGNQVVYDRSLAKAKSWIADYFPQELSSVSAIQLSLEQLQALRLTPELPDISGSLRQLRQVMNLLLKQQQANG